MKIVKLILPIFAGIFFGIQANAQDISSDFPRQYPAYDGVCGVLLNDPDCAIQGYPAYGSYPFSRPYYNIYSYGRGYGHHHHHHGRSTRHAGTGK